MRNRSTLVSGLALSLALISMAPLAFAGEVQNREERQQDRIDQGIQSGQLTSKESANLEKREDKLEADRQAALADGKITPKERRKLNHEENRDSRKIYRKKHNKRTAKPEASPTTTS